jgi:hypothetical protein
MFNLWAPSRCGRLGEGRLLKVRRFVLGVDEAESTRAFARTPDLIVFVKVTPTLMVSWVNKDNEPFMEYLDLQNKRAYLTIPWEKQE